MSYACEKVSGRAISRVNGTWAHPTFHGVVQDLERLLDLGKGSG